LLKFKFKSGESKLEIRSTSKYIGVILSTVLDFIETGSVLRECAGRAFSMSDI